MSPDFSSSSRPVCRPSSNRIALATSAVAAGMIVKAAKSRGRSRHCTAIDRLADHVGLWAAKTAARLRAHHVALSMEVGTKHQERRAALTSTMTCVSECRRGGTPRAGPCSPTVPLCAPRTVGAVGTTSSGTAMKTLPDKVLGSMTRSDSAGPKATCFGPRFRTGVASGHSCGPTV